MTIFETIFTDEQICVNSSSIEEHVNVILKRDNERNMFNQFLNSVNSTGTKVSDILDNQSEIHTTKMANKGIVVDDNLVFEFAVSVLKMKNGEPSSPYDLIVRKIVEQNEPEYVNLHHNIDAGKFDGKVPLGYPNVCKNAQGMLNAKIKDSIPQMRIEYLKNKFIKEKVAELSREMFYGINNLNLKDGDLVRYLSVMFELSLKKVAPIENEPMFKKQIAEAIQLSIPVEIIYIKSLRYSYPDGKRMKVISHLDDEQTFNQDGSVRHYYNEYLILDRLKEFKNIFSHYNISANLTILVADNDLDILFKKGAGFVPDSDIDLAKVEVQKYIANLQVATNDLTSETYLLTKFLKHKKIENKYQDKVNIVYLDTTKDKRTHITEKDIEERVNYRLEFFRGIYGNNYSKDIARQTMNRQVAHVMALSEVFKNFDQPPIIVIDFRGNENKLIGGLDPKSRSVFLTKLKEPTIIQ